MDGHVFEAAAQLYDVFRPRYPEPIFYAILNFWGGGADPTVVDMGCGTGISSRGMHRALGGKCTMIGVDQSAEMLATARAGNTLPIAYVLGRAEDFPPEVMRADIILAAQSAHWFDRGAFYREALRVLPANGVVAILENLHHWENSPFLQAHEAFLEEFAVDPKRGEPYRRISRRHPYVQELSVYFEDTIEKKLCWSARMSLDKFYQTACTCPQFRRAQHHVGEAAAKRLFHAYGDLFSDGEGMVTVDYVTRLYAGRGPRY